MEKQDLIEKCRECGNEFTITVSEQNFYESRDLICPKRCAECRAARKKQNMETAAKEVKSEITMSLEEMMKEAGI